MSENRIRASRLNGALSRGPITPEGKANSAANAVRHGLLAETILVGRESRVNFHEILYAIGSPRIDGWDDKGTLRRTHGAQIDEHPASTGLKMPDTRHQWQMTRA